MLLLQPAYGMVGQIPVEDIGRVAGWRRDRLGILDQSRRILVGVAAIESIEILKALAHRPMIEWPDLTLLPLRRQVPFSECGGAEAVLP